MRTGRRYEVRSASHTAWWRTDDIRKAFAILRSHGTCSDYVFDTVTGGRPSDPDLDYSAPGCSPWRRMV